MMGYIIKCGLERFLISTAYILLLDEKGKAKGQTFALEYIKDNRAKDPGMGGVKF